MSEQAKCKLCGEPMPPGEEMFNYHGYSGHCPKPPLPKTEPVVPTPSDGSQPDNDTLADMATVELLHTLATPINGVPSVQFIDYNNARRLVKAALLAVFEAGGSSK